MAKIIVKHTSIVINDYNIGDCEKLENYFSVYNPTTHSYDSKGIEYIEEEKKLIIPRGIDIYYLKQLLGGDIEVDKQCDPYDHIDNILIKYLPRDDDQKEALRFALGKQEYADNKSKSQLAINLPTGKGKSYVTIAAQTYYAFRSIIITSSLNWLNQWKDYFLEYTNISAKEIFFMSGSASIFSLLRKDISKYKVILASHATLKSYGDTYGWDKITELFQFLRVGMKAYDEAHLSFDNMCKVDFYTNTKYTYYVTATPARSNKDENFIYQLYFKNIPSIDLFDEDKDPHTKYIAIKYNSHPTVDQLSDCKNQYGLDRNKYVNYIVDKENYHKMIHILLDLIDKSNGKALIYIGTNKGIKNTKEWIVENCCIGLKQTVITFKNNNQCPIIINNSSFKRQVISFDDRSNFYTELKDQIGIYTSDETLRPSGETKEQQLDKKIILSTTKSCGAAMDIKGLKMTIVLAEPFKSEVLATQTLGRTRDKNTIYIEIVDTGFFHINKYYNEKKPIFNKRATSCTEVILKDNDLDNKVNQIILNKQLSKSKCPIFFSNKERRQVIKFIE